MVAVVTRVQWFDVKLLYTRSRATDGSTIARGLRGAIYRGGKGIKGSIYLSFVAPHCLLSTLNTPGRVDLLSILTDA